MGVLWDESALGVDFFSQELAENVLPKGNLRRGSVVERMCETLSLGNGSQNRDFAK